MGVTQIALARLSVPLSTDLIGPSVPAPFPLPSESAERIADADGPEFRIQFGFETVIH